MEQRQYLVDTNSVIDYLGNVLPKAGKKFMDGVMDEIPSVSVVTKIELLGFNTAEEYYRMLSDFINDATVFNLTDDIVAETISIRRNCKTKLPDAIIAATALVYGLTLITRNTADFKSISELKLLDPHSL